MKTAWLIPAILVLASCSGKEPVYWYDAAASEKGGSSVPYYPDKPAQPVDPEAPVEGYAPEGYHLVWQDEFDVTLGLYRDWEFEKGGTGWGNDEQQYYCENGIYEPTGDKTAEIVDGTLRITAKKITASSQSDNKEYISARLNTKKSWKYGYIEMKAKLPKDKGTWTAFWMLPEKGVYPSWVRDDSMKGGELDILEFVPGDDPNNIYFSAHSYNATPDAPDGKNSKYVDPSDPEKSYSYFGKTSITNPDTEWHWFGFEWTHEYVKGFLDGTQFYYATNPTPDFTPQDANPSWGFDKPFYIKLNLAMGGSWGGAIPSTFTSTVYVIDYIRVYQKI